MKRIVFSLSFLALLAGCGAARHSVVAPEQVSTLHQTDWVIKSEPAKSGAPTE